MASKVIKRDGRKENYDFSKVKVAVTRTFSECDEAVSDKFLSQLEEEMSTEFKDVETISVEDIHNLIEKFLIKKNKYNIVKAYVLMREARNKERELNGKVMKGMREKLDAKNIQNQNANLDEMSFGGRTGEAIRVASKEIALSCCMSEMARRNHIENLVYIHDLDSFVVGEHNCLTFPFDERLKHGVKTKQTDVREANSINTAMQLVAVNFQLQSLQQFGGVSASHIDWTMVPYVRKSFNKHFRDGLVYVEECPDQVDAYKNPSGSVIEDVSIEDPWYKDFPKAYKYAMDMTIRETHQAVEGMYHNLNTLQSRSGNQLPFTSINYGTCTLPEGRMVIKEILEVSLAGLGKFGRTSIFPCGIFQCMKGVNQYPGEPNYDLFRLALQSTAKRIYPNYCNCDTTMNDITIDRRAKAAYIGSLSSEDKEKLAAVLKEDKHVGEILDLYVDYNGTIQVDYNWKPYEIYSTMGCRTVNGLDINFLDTYKSNVTAAINHKPMDESLRSAFQKDGRGNICPVTIILPSLAMIARKTEEKKLQKMAIENGTEVPEASSEAICDTFMHLLDRKIGEAKDMLIERFNWICKQPAESGKFMYENHTMAGYIPEEGIVSALKHGTLTIGLLGMAEASQLIFGHDHTSGDGMQFADIVVALYGQRCKEFKEKYKLNFGVYYTPAESLCHTALKKFRKEYGIIPDVSDKEYFTNSIHVPVWKDVDPFEKIDIESRWASKGNAGTITYVELPSSVKNNIEALETLVRYAMDKDIPYFAVNLPLDCCEDCGYQDEIGPTCPKCGGTNITRLRRVTGYLSTDYHNFNYGKQCETEMRVKHVKN